MADSDGFPQRDDRHHRRSRYRSPVSPEWTGETPPEREERRLAEAAVRVGPPPPAQEPEPAEVTPACRPSSKPCRPAPGGGPRRAGSGDRSPSEPRRGRDRVSRHTADTGGSPGAGTGRIAEGCRSRRGEQGGAREGLQPRPQQAAPPPQPATPRPPARREGGGRTPHGPRAPRRRPAQQQQWAGRARSTAPTPTPPTPTPVPPSRFPPSPSPRGGRGTSAPRRPSARRRASRCRSCKDQGTPGA